MPIEIVLAVQKMKERAEYIVLETPGANALDFHIAYYLGIAITTDPSAFFHIISKDTGFDPLIKHLRAKKINVFRAASIEEMSCFKQAEKPVVAVVPVTPSLTDMIKIAVNWLVKQKLAKPGTKKTLLNTLESITKSYPLIRPEQVFEGLLKAGYISVSSDEKITYKLPNLS
ncbi:MAG: hypothetical protein JZU59_16335 [Chromatium okenii]|nr:hypothetical protein [Chromatium okenii]